MTQVVPYDFESTLDLPDWRQCISWPITQEDCATLFTAILRDYLTLTKDLSGEERKLAILAAGPFAGLAMTACEVAVCLSQQGQYGVEIKSASAEFDYLSGKTDLPPPPDTGSIVRFSKPRLPFRRNLQVTSWWTPWHRMPVTIVAPDAVAVMENSLLISTARKSTSAIAFKHAGDFMARIRRKVSPPEPDQNLIARARQLAVAMSEIPDVDADIRSRLETFLVLNYEAFATVIAGDMARVAKLDGLPAHIWAGTGAYYPTRLLGLEVMARGGKVTLFDHGGTHGMANHPETFAALEMLACTEYVMPSERLAQVIRDSPAFDYLAPSHQPTITGASGEPGFNNLVEWDRPTGAEAPRRVLYCPSLLMGFRRHAFATVPDAVYLDWTLRLATLLRALDIQLLCKPHPEGILKGFQNPIELIAPTSYRMFEQEVATTDVFVFDRANSTAFWKALCTDRPVILITMSPPGFSPPLADLFNKRCTVIEVDFDDRNRPQIDKATLSRAILNGPTSVDPAQMQALMAESGAP